MYKKAVVYEDENFRVDMERFGDLHFIHCHVDKFSKATLGKMREVFEETRELLRSFGFDSIYSYTRNVKFAKMINPDFTSYPSIVFNNEEYEVVGWQ